MRKLLELLPISVQAFVRAIVRSPINARGFAFGHSARATSLEAIASAKADPENPLYAYFQSHDEGRGIWKWEHYFRIYHRHFQKFIGQECRLLEIGILSGGSLEMWRDYLGSQSRIVGVDIDPACEVYASEQVSIHIGDQGDRQFWRRLKQQESPFDIIVDDGSHLFLDQAATFEEMLFHLRPGGVFLCEDVHGIFNKMPDYLLGLTANLNAWAPEPPSKETPTRFCSPATEFQRSIFSVHLYPFVVVVERTDAPCNSFYSSQKGTSWQPAN
jgi:Methyltransferase domain